MMTNPVDRAVKPAADRRTIGKMEAFSGEVMGTEAIWENWSAAFMPPGCFGPVRGE
jgi:hypothetical protein